MKAIWIAESEARYGRDKVICFGRARCNVCRVSQDCLTFDHSDEEYGDIAICKDCVLLAFAEKGAKRLAFVPETELPSEGQVKP